MVSSNENQYRTDYVLLTKKEKSINTVLNISDWTPSLLHILLKFSVTQCTSSVLRPIRPHSLCRRHKARIP